MAEKQPASPDVPQLSPQPERQCFFRTGKCLEQADDQLFGRFSGPVDLALYPQTRLATAVNGQGGRKHLDAPSVRDQAVDIKQHRQGDAGALGKRKRELVFP